jgi:transcriptional regulator EpsA
MQSSFPDNNLAFLEAMSSLTLVVSRQGFIEWTRDQLQAAFPHGAFIGGIGQCSPSGAIPFELVSSNFPDTYLNFIQLDHRHYKTPTMQKWLDSGQPQLWLKAFETSELRNIAAYGIFDISGLYLSYFSFHQIPRPLGEWHRLLLKIIVPNMHLALLNLVRQDVPPLENLFDVPPITPREREVLVWICEGKTSAEIASILGISCKTIINHSQSILEKLGVRNRAQAVSKAYQLRLVRLRLR